MRRTVCTMALLSMLASQSVSADVLWSQPQADSFGGLSSQDARNPGGLGWFSEVADNFVGQTDWIVDEVEFYGGYATPLGQEGNTEGFTIRFYSDNGGHPGTQIFEQDVFSFTETNYYVQPSLGFAGYRYSLSLSPAFDVPSDGAYWVSVVAILARGGGANEPQWGWIASSAVTDPRAHQWFFAPGQFSEQGNDVAFSLISNDAPPCPADLDGDGVVSLSDMAVLLAHFGISGTTPADGDLDGNAVVDISDLAILLASFGTACP